MEFGHVAKKIKTAFDPELVRQRAINRKLEKVYGSANEDSSNWEANQVVALTLGGIQRFREWVDKPGIPTTGGLALQMQAEAQQISLHDVEEA